MKEIYPQIREFSQQRGVEFNVVDLRWGIPDTATNDHMTHEICMAEINRCHTQSILAPCFIYLGFNRYKLIMSLSHSHTWRAIVFIQPGMEHMSIIVCAFKALVD